MSRQDSIDNAGPILKFDITAAMVAEFEPHRGNISGKYLRSLLQQHSRDNPVKVYRNKYCAVFQKQDGNARTMGRRSRRAAVSTRPHYNLDVVTKGGHLRNSHATKVMAFALWDTRPEVAILNEVFAGGKIVNKTKVPGLMRKAGLEAGLDIGFDVGEHYFMISYTAEATARTRR